MQFKRTLQLDEDGDIALDEQNTYSTLDGVRSVVQELKVRILTIRGEQVFDRDVGLRLFEVTGAPDSVVEREVKFTLGNDPRVDRVNSVEVTQDEYRRKKQITATVTLVETSDPITFEVTTG
jgi:hypothetical protein